MQQYTGDVIASKLVRMYCEIALLFITEKEIRNLPLGHENRRSVCSTAANENLGRHTDSEMELTSPIRINWKAEPWA